MNEINQTFSDNSGIIFKKALGGHRSGLKSLGPELRAPGNVTKQGRRKLADDGDLSELFIGPKKLRGKRRETF